MTRTPGKPRTSRVQFPLVQSTLGADVLRLAGRSLADPPDGALVHYTMEQIQDDTGTIRDVSGNARHATVFPVASEVAGVVNSHAVRLDGTDAYLSLAEHDPLVEFDVAAMSVALWLKTTTSGTDWIFVNDRNNGYIEAFVSARRLRAKVVLDGGTEYSVITPSSTAYRSRRSNRMARVTIHPATYMIAQSAQP